MNKEQYETVRTQQAQPFVIGINQLADLTPRTLIFGYDIERNTHHVYLGEDGHIHVLRYRPLSGREPTEGPRFLMLSHTYGTTGGVSENSGYIPSKRTYPESCDFEFCSLLAKEGVSLSFTTFNEESGPARIEKHHGYAGFILEDGGVELVSFTDKVVAEVSFPGELRGGPLAKRVIVEACRSLGAYYDASEEYDSVSVAANRAEEVMTKVRELAATLPPHILLDGNLRRKLFEKAFGLGHCPDFGRDSTYGGRLTVTVESGAPTEFQSEGAIQPYEPAVPGVEWPKAVTGLFKGHRYIVVLHNVEGSATITLSQFGDSKGLLKLLENYGLAPCVPA